MSELLERPPYGAREDATFLREMEQLTRHHLAGCPLYARIWAHWKGAESAEELPFLHVGLFKRLALRTEKIGIVHERTLHSSSTTGSRPSHVLSLIHI